MWLSPPRFLTIIMNILLPFIDPCALLRSRFQRELNNICGSTWWLTRAVGLSLSKTSRRYPVPASSNHGASHTPCKWGHLLWGSIWLYRCLSLGRRSTCSEIPFDSKLWGEPNFVIGNTAVYLSYIPRYSHDTARNLHPLELVEYRWQTRTRRDAPHLMSSGECKSEQPWDTIHNC